MDQLKAAHRKAVECHTLALPLMSPPGERVTVPYLYGSLIGVLRKPSGVARPPVALILLGLDSAKEEMDSYTVHVLERGIATLVVDGPGQGEAEYTLPICPGYETVITSTIDWIETRADLDAGRVALWGVSLGAYYAARGAAFEARAKACVSICGPYDWSINWDGKPFLSREVFRVRSHSASDAEAKDKAALLSLAGVAEKITCPLYVVAGTRDLLCTPDEQRRLAAEARGEVVLSVIEGGDHVVHNLHYRYRSQTVDWLVKYLR
jgi:fermentation-respiration switch protein FrsA (DUF1100 family)